MVNAFESFHPFVFPFVTLPYAKIQIFLACNDKLETETELSGSARLGGDQGRPDRGAQAFLEMFNWVQVRTLLLHSPPP